MTKLALFQNIPLLLSLIIPFKIGVIALLLKRRMYHTLSLILILVLSINIINNFSIYIHNGPGTLSVLELIPGLSLAFHIEPFALIFSSLAVVLWLITYIYSMWYMDNTDINFKKFYAYIAFSIGSAIASIYSANLFTFFIFYELLSMVTYPLIAEFGGNKESAKKYLLLLMGASSILLLPAIATTFNLAGSISFSPHGIIAGKANDLTIITLLIVYIFAINKTAIMPLHSWLVSAMVAPIPVSALLHSVAVVNTGIFGLLKVTTYIFGLELLSTIRNNHLFIFNILMLIPIITIVMASIAAIRKDSIKKLLAYSTISQLSYPIMSIMLFSKQALVAAISHTIAHSYSKLGLFFVAGIIYKIKGYTKLSELNGIGRNMSILVFGTVIFITSIIGIPPTAGFLSKTALFEIAKSQINGTIVTLALYAGSVLTICYLIPFMYKLIWQTQGNKASKIYLPKTVQVAITSLIILIIILFIFDFDKIISSIL
jgi:multicomponent Na+:H+ antiporter subunit D